MKAASALLKLLHRLLTLLEVIALLFAGLYAVYALWDNRQIDRAAEVIQENLLRYKPVQTVPEETGEEEREKSLPDFRELKAINADICAWLCLDGTKIDYPVLHGATNLSYISTDVYGNFALHGSIFLDSRNAGDWSDAYSLVYGHHMTGHRMFGDLELYREEDFFEKNRSGILVLPEGSFRLSLVACLQAGASEKLLFDPAYSCRNRAALLSYIREHAECLEEAELEQAARPETRILAMTTCSGDFTDSRTVVIARLEGSV